MKLLQVGAVALLSVGLGTCTRLDEVPFGGTGGTASGGSKTSSAGAGSAPTGTGAASGGGVTGSGAAPPMSGGGVGSNGGAGPTGPTWGPKGHEPLALERLGPSLLAYMPNRGGAFAVRGSGHTHCAPDHSDIDAATQERRLRDLSGTHRHDFVWMTAHSFVAPDPNVGGIVHMFGIEVYTATLQSGAAPHMLGYLPDGSLANATSYPFGVFDLDLSAAAARVREHGGLPALAHPARVPPSDVEMDAVDERLWGMEVTSGSSDAEANLAMVDHRLSSGRYVCLTAGGDIHDEEYRLTSGYQVVSVAMNPPDPAALFAAISSCNMYACGTRNAETRQIDPPTLRVVDGSIELSLPTAAETIRFIGKGGTVLAAFSGAQSAKYAPKLDDLYVRVEAFGSGRDASCYSQPIWMVDETTLSSAP